MEKTEKTEKTEKVCDYCGGIIDVPVKRLIFVNRKTVLMVFCSVLCGGYHQMGCEG